MQKLVSIVTKVPKHMRHDDDAVDRLHHRYTVLVLATFAAVVSMQQYVGKPITCWAPKHFTGSHTKYTNSYCWVNNTYFLPFEDRIPRPHESRREIIYYQWVPFILLLQAFFFYAPCLVWRAFNSKAGVDADNILEAANSFQSMKKLERRDKTLRLITNQVDRFLSNPRQKSGWTFSLQHCLASTLCLACGKRLGNYLVMLFLFVKVLYIGNVFGQLFLLNRILKTDYNLFGLEVIRKAVQDTAWLNATVFPKVTMCDMVVRRLGNVQRYTVQCLLPINLYTEIVYTFIWFWMVVLLGITCFSFLTWLVRALLAPDRLKYIGNHLGFSERAGEQDLMRRFVFDYLKQDGVFLLRLIGHNTNNITATEIIASVWDNWRSRQAALTRRQQTPPTPPPKPKHLKFRPQANHCEENNVSEKKKLSDIP